MSLFTSFIIRPWFCPACLTLNADMDESYGYASLVFYVFDVFEIKIIIFKLFIQKSMYTL